MDICVFLSLSWIPPVAIFYIAYPRCLKRSIDCNLLLHFHELSASKVIVTFYGMKLIYNLASFLCLSLQE
jgi:hypothetical protein